MDICNKLFFYHWVRMRLKILAIAVWIRVLLVLALHTPFVTLQCNLGSMCKTKLNNSFSFPYLSFFLSIIIPFHFYSVIHVGSA